ncbi:AAA family ATPase [Synoicihabitans lomoniglobus]|uniref:Rad50/SbcC-type AAA domain-containing protein n=1 Tax=Synoicihabitans lomoniglobus TaxID=2909285 RepID=A0AAF0I397_9BACT|nr:hypothetical protein [Opitutaceae bacterium LMO-M01]WED66208.1 hypothetical protein PXH66_05025 [Opitutaceae bacterium LMO-M01]
MILHAIELHHVGRFRESVRLGPFAPGLNVLSAPNESGKSTSLHAAARALFDRHTTKGEELKSLQPVGTDLAPRIAVEFETAAGRFRIEKTFLQKPTSELRAWQSASWQLIAESDQADQRVQALLHSSLPGRGATKSEHWGFLGFLWARQGEPAVWPGFNDEGVGQNIRAQLVQLELDPVIERLRERLAATFGSILTATGQPRTGGPLRTAEDDLTRLDEELTQLHATRTKLEDALVRYQQAASGVTQLAKEHAERTAAAATLHESAQAAERLSAELKTHQHALLTAQEKLDTVAADATKLAHLRQLTAEAQTAITAAEHTAATATQKRTDLRARLDAMQTERPQRESALQTRRVELQRAQGLLRLRQHTETAAALARQIAKVEATAAELAELKARQAKLPDLTPAQLRKLEDLAEQTRTLTAQLQALGLTVELTPDRDALVAADGKSQNPDPKSQTEIPAGQTTTLRSPQTLDLHLADWGRIVIRSGAQETQNVAKELDTAHTALRNALEKAEVPTLDAAREAVTERRELDTQLKTLGATLASQLGEHDTLADLQDTAASAARRADAQAATLPPTAADHALSQADLEATEARLSAALPAEEKALTAFDREMERIRTEERTATQTEQTADKQLTEQRGSLRTHEAQTADLMGRYADGLDAAKTAAQIAFTQAEARVAAAKAQLPPDYDKLPERNKRAAVSLQQIANELQARRTERDQAKGTLETLGGQGLYSRETELEEKKVEATLRRDAARAQGWTTRIAHDLIEHRKQAATKAVLTPLEQRLTAAFAELSGDPTRQVFLNEQLQIAGIGRTREATHAFDQLSQGAKEQLLLCLRLAVAQELATDEPQVLILDDVLVNTDPVRQERILDVLGAQATHLQILILTCHPDRYRGVGQAVNFTI